MKTFLFFFFVFIHRSCPVSDVVYICDSKNAKKYHYKATCRGLSNCTYKIVKTTVEKAKNSGKTTLCGWED